MLDMHRPRSPRLPKTYFTHSLLPTYIDPHHVSTKKFPFSAIAAQPFSHTLDLILPAEMYTLIETRLSTTVYARAHLKLADILDPDFLNTYIKHGNVSMLSEGRPAVDNRFSVRDGKLRMELDRATYERCGLVGTPVDDGGKKHQKARWLVVCDLALPSMRHGKKGFGRLLWAATHVLNHSLTWLWWSANPSAREALEDKREVLSRHAPWIHAVAASVLRLECVSCPTLIQGELCAVYGEDEAMSLLEYLGFLALDSPRVRAEDAIDPHLSRYQVPDLGNGVHTRDLVRLRWKGFLTPAFARDVFLDASKAAFQRGSRNKVGGEQHVDMGDDDEPQEETWFAMSAQGFGGKTSWTTMQFASRETLTWQVES
ncbi:hypothetical protein ACEQ8H_008367 [Pleosporales sp. CAS-2024a]